MACNNFNPLEIPQNEQEKISWVQKFWNNVFENRCLGICESSCTLNPLNDGCRSCLQEQILDSTNIATISKFPDGADCSNPSTRACVSCILRSKDNNYENLKKCVRVSKNRNHIWNLVFIIISICILVSFGIVIIYLNIHK